MKQELRTRLTICLGLAMFSLVLTGLGWTSYKFARYLQSTPGLEVRKLSVTGLKVGDENQVLAMAGFELGANVFRADLEKVREKVELLPWVRHALVQRVLPDQIIIRVFEREPVGIARIRGEIFQFDLEGVILEPDPAVIASFPVLDGLRPGDDEGNIEKVRLYREVLEQLGQTELSEVHLNDGGEVSVVSAHDPLLVNLGAGDFQSRWIKYLQLKTQIRQQYPQAVRVDLRFQNQVIVRMRDDDTGESIEWDAGKRML